MNKPTKSGWQLPLDQDPTPRSLKEVNVPEDIALQYASSKPLLRRSPSLPDQPTEAAKPDPS